jgi:hypothetical protein
MGVGSSNRKNQWQARILVHGKVTHLGYYETEEAAARVYDRVSIALHGDHAQTNFAGGEYPEAELSPYRGLDRENLQRALGVKPMDKSSRFRGVSKKKGKWEAKVMVNRRWAYRELFDSEEEAARAYDRALWRLKPREARSYVNFKDELPAEAAAALAAGGEYGGASDDGGPLPSEGGFDDEDDDGSGDDDDYEYEYRPSKGTQRSASMRANKRSGSAPNLSRAAAAAAAAAGGGGGAGRPAAAPAPAFVPMAGGGLQLQFGAGPPPPGMVPVSQPGDEPLLIRVGSEVHFLAPHAPRPSHPPLPTLGKRSGLQRIQSEPQLAASTRDAGLLAFPGVVASDVHGLEHDRDLFRGLSTPFGGAGGELPSLLDYMQAETPLAARAAAGSLFEDEESALASLEFDSERPRKISKSASMTALAQLAQLQAEEPAAAGGGGGGGGGGAARHPERLGPLGQPIRRVATFTTSLPAFEEGEEKGGGEGRMHMPSQHSSEGARSAWVWLPVRMSALPRDADVPALCPAAADDLVRQLLEPLAQMPELEDTLRLLHG